MVESTVTAKGQTTLPKDVRKALQLQPGDRLRYLVLDNGEVRLVRSRAAVSLSGLLKDQVQRKVTLEDMEEAIASGAGGA